MLNGLTIFPMRHHLLIVLLVLSWSAQAQTGSPPYRNKSLRLNGSMGLSERNDTARSSMVVDSVKRHLIGASRGARLTASTALTNVPASSLTCFLGNSADLTNKPILTSLRGLANDADYQTGVQVRTSVRTAADTHSARLLATSATANQALAQANAGGGTTSITGSLYTIQYRATNVSTTSGSAQALTHNFGPNTGIDRIVAYEINTRVSVDMPFDTGSVTDTQVTIQPVSSTTYTAIIVIGHKLQ